MSRRDTYYFPHEYNAKDDPKCERLISVMGMEGYGIFWALLEVLRVQPDYTYPLVNIPIVAHKYYTIPGFLNIADKIHPLSQIPESGLLNGCRLNISSTGLKAVNRRFLTRKSNEIPTISFLYFDSSFHSSFLFTAAHTGFRLITSHRTPLC